MPTLEEFLLEAARISPLSLELTALLAYAALIFPTAVALLFLWPSSEVSRLPDGSYVSTRINEDQIIVLVIGSFFLPLAWVGMVFGLCIHLAEYVFKQPLPVLAMKVHAYNHPEAKASRSARREAVRAAKRKNKELAKIAPEDSGQLSTVDDGHLSFTGRPR